MSAEHKHEWSERGLIARQAHKYDLVGAALFGGRRKRVYRRVAALTGFTAGESALDVGCGTGYLTRALAQAGAPSATVIGIDPAEEMLDRARNSTKLPRCRFELGVAQALPCGDSSVDVVTSSLAFHHIPHDLRDTAMSEALRVLRPGGRVLIADFDPPVSELGKRFISAVLSPEVLRTPISEISPTLARAGFTDLAVHRVKPWMYCVTAGKPLSSG